MSNKEKSAKIAQELVSSISPLILEGLRKEELTFVGLTVVVDNKYSTTFPFHAVPVGGESGEVVANEDVSKALLLGAVEYARVAGVLKAQAIKSLEDLFDE
jgi:hypothetical protein